MAGRLNPIKAWVANIEQYCGCDSDRNIVAV